MRSSFAMKSRLPAAIVVLLLTLAMLGVVAPAAHAAPPWRFTEVADSTTIPGNSIAGATATCPEGFIPVGGGLWNVDKGPGTFEIMSAYRLDARTFHVAVHNYDSETVATVNVVCALESQVGSLTYVTKDVARDPTTGHVHDAAVCPTGSKALIGGADWSAGAGTTRRVDFQAPVVTGAGWYASGWSPVAGAVLTIDAYCISSAALGAANFVSQDTAYPGGATAVTAQISCPAGTRPGSGGVQAVPSNNGPLAGFMGNDWFSAPSVSEPAFKMTSWAEPGMTLRRNVWCLPASQPTVTFTQTPPSLTNSSDATFAFSVVEPAGETVESITCAVDGGSAAGCNFTGTSVNGLAPGVHTFSVMARNQSYQTTTATYQWRIDTTPPEVLTPLARPAVTGPIVVGFSELVSGVPAGLAVTEAGKSTPLAGSWSVISSFSPDTLATFTPTRPLVPGRRYEVSASSAIQDMAGNAMVPQTEQVRTTLTVQNSSPALTERWDRDTDTNASGGSFIESSARGSRATWTVRTDAGESVTVTGARRPNGGYGGIYVDGVRVKRVSFYRSTPAWKLALFQTEPLSAGRHTISVRVDGTKPSGSTGTWLGVDAILVGTSLVQEGRAVQTFRRVSAAGGSYDTVFHRRSGDNGGAPMYQLVFDGTGIKGYVTKTPTSGTADVVIDGTKVSTISLYSATAQYAVLGFNVTGLAPGPHTLRLIPVGTTSGTQSAVGLDRLVVQ